MEKHSIILFSNWKRTHFIYNALFSYYTHFLIFVDLGVDVCTGTQFICHLRTEITCTSQIISWIFLWYWPLLISENSDEQNNTSESEWENLSRTAWCASLTFKNMVTPPTGGSLKHLFWTFLLSPHMLQSLYHFPPSILAEIGSAAQHCLLPNHSRRSRLATCLCQSCGSSLREKSAPGTGGGAGRLSSRGSWVLLKSHY